MVCDCCLCSCRRVWSVSLQHDSVLDIRHSRMDNDTCMGYSKSFSKMNILKVILLIITVIIIEEITISHRIRNGK